MIEIVSALLFGWLIADFLSGLLHWLEDRVLWVGMPLLSAAIVEPNRLHHRAPLAFLDSRFVDRNWTSWVAALPIALAWLVVFGFSAELLGALCGALVANEVHALAHRPRNVPRWVRALQWTGLIQSPEYHRLHHLADRDRAYCVLTNWLNPWLDLIGFWGALERLLTIVGLEPNRGTK